MEIPFVGEDFIHPNEIQKRSKEIGEAISRGETLQDVFEIEDTLMDQKFRAAYEFMIEGDSKSSHELASYLAAMNPYEERNWLIRSFCKIMKGDYNMAILGLAFTKMLRPKDPFPYALASYCYLKNEDITGSLDLLSIAKALSGDKTLLTIFEEIEEMVEKHENGEVGQEAEEHLLGHFTYLINKIFEKKGWFKTKQRTLEERKEEHQGLHKKLHDMDFSVFPANLPQEYAQFFAHFKGNGRGNFVEFALSALGFMSEKGGNSTK